MSVEVLTAWFPFSIEPDVIVGNAKYTKECYMSIMDQLGNKVDVHDRLDGLGICIGETVDVKENKVSIRIHNKPFISRILTTNETFCIATSLDVEAEPDDKGVMVATSANIIGVSLIPKITQSQISKIDSDVIAKEKTFKLDM